MSRLSRPKKVAIISILSICLLILSYAVLAESNWYKDNSWLKLKLNKNWQSATKESCPEIIELFRVQLDGDVSNGDVGIGCDVSPIYNEKDRKVYVLYYYFNWGSCGSFGFDCISEGPYYKIYDPKNKKFYDWQEPSINPHSFSEGCRTSQRRETSLFKTRDKFYWIVNYLPYAQDSQYGCEINGYYIYNFEGLYKDKIYYKYYPVDCSNPDQRKKYAFNTGPNRGAPYSNYTADQCYYSSSRDQKRCDLCDYIQDAQYKDNCLGDCK